MSSTAAIRSVLIMGPTGCGKSTLGSALARALGWPFLEGDTLHPASNIAKMAAGTPLDDADRRPFLQNIAQAIATRATDGLVVSCSALKRAYRDQLRTGDARLLFVLPMMPRARLLARLRQRSDHFMPASLLDSQLAILEPPQPDESFIQVSGDSPTSEQVRQVLDAATARRLIFAARRQ
jgi:gluconokinase